MQENLNNNSVIINDGNINTVQKGITLYDHRTLFIQQTTKTILGDAAETSFFDDTNAIGTRTIPANLLRVGSVIRMNLRCSLTSVGNPSNTIKIKLDGVDIINSTVTLGATHTNDYAELQFEIDIRSIGNISAGKVTGMGRTIIAGTSDLSRSLIVSTPVAIDTTAALPIDVTYDWGGSDASNSLVIVQAVIQILN